MTKAAVVSLSASLRDELASGRRAGRRLGSPSRDDPDPARVRRAKPRRRQPRNSPRTRSSTCSRTALDPAVDRRSGRRRNPRGAVLDPAAPRRPVHGSAVAWMDGITGSAELSREPHGTPADEREKHGRRAQSPQAEGGRRARRGGSSCPRTGRSASLFCSVTPVPVEKPNPWHCDRDAHQRTGTGSVDRREPAAASRRSGTASSSSHRSSSVTSSTSTAGMLLGDCLDAVVLACEDALNDGELKRPIEILPMVARGLPREEARDRGRRLRSAVRRRVPRGDWGPYITDNAMAMLPGDGAAAGPGRVDQRRQAVPQPLRLHARQRRRVRRGCHSAPGGCGRRASSASRRSPRSSPGGEEYAKAFRAAAKRNRVNLVADVFVDQTGDDLADVLQHLHDEVHPDAIAYLGLRLPGCDVQPDPA